MTAFVKKAPGLELLSENYPAGNRALNVTVLVDLVYVSFSATRKQGTRSGETRTRKYVFLPASSIMP